MSFLLASLLGIWLVLSPAQGHALEDFLEEARRADFSGRQVVVCWSPAGSVVGDYQVRQADGRIWVRQGTDQAMVTAGELIEHKAESGWRRVKVPQTVAPFHAGRYRIVEGGKGVRFGRHVVVMEVWEGDLVRSRFVFDRATSVPLATEVYNGDGTLYRMSTFVEFSFQSPSLPDPEKSPMPEVVLTPAASEQMISELAGYALRGVYEAPGDSLHSYFSDGLFSFSVFRMPGAVPPGEMADAPVMEVGDHSYRLRFLPGEAWVFWQGGDGSYLLVGDLPLDHLEAVLEALPPPEEPGLLKRVWRLLFRR